MGTRHSWECIREIETHDDIPRMVKIGFRCTECATIKWMTQPGGGWQYNHSDGQVSVRAGQCGEGPAYEDVILPHGGRKLPRWASGDADGEEE